MNEFLAFSLLASHLAFDVFCMDIDLPDFDFEFDFDILPPPPPENVEFGECLYALEITGGNLPTVSYLYNYICPVKFPDNVPQPLLQDKDWYFVGSISHAGFEISQDLSLYDYKPIKQSHIKFVFLKDATVKFAQKSIKKKFEIRFDSLQRCQEFYEMIYHDVDLSQTAPQKIGLLHEMMIEENINKEIGSSVEVRHETINDYTYITFKDEQGRPLLIFSEVEAAVTRFTHKLKNKAQLLLHVKISHYILTFSNDTEAKEFSACLLKHIVILFMGRVYPNIRAHFQANQITMNSPNV